jgi:hypothetical protein
LADHVTLKWPVEAIFIFITLRPEMVNRETKAFKNIKLNVNRSVIVRACSYSLNPWNYKR